MIVQQSLHIQRPVEGIQCPEALKIGINLKHVSLQMQPVCSRRHNWTEAFSY